MDIVTQVVNGTIINNPSRCVRTTYDLTKMNIFDHIFNVIGNGVRDIDEFNEFIECHKTDKNIPDWYFGNDPIYDVVPVTDLVIGEKKFKIIDSDRDRIYFVTASKAKEYNTEDYEIKEIPKSDTVSLYPNFNKSYSILWKIDLDKISKDWIRSGIWFYTQCKDYFNSDKCNNYSDAITEDNITNRVEKIEKYFPTLFGEVTDEKTQHYIISDAYGVEYTGDTKDFLIRRWEKEKQRIIDFIDETIDMLEQKIK